MVKHANVLGTTNKQFGGSWMDVHRCWRKGNGVIKMGLKEIGYEVRVLTRLAQDRLSGELHIFEVKGGQETS
jgi:hypothetical protein